MNDENYNLKIKNQSKFKNVCNNITDTGFIDSKDYDGSIDHKNQTNIQNFINECGHYCSVHEDPTTNRNLNQKLQKLLKNWQTQNPQIVPSLENDIKKYECIITSMKKSEVLAEIQSIYTKFIDILPGNDILSNKELKKELKNTLTNMSVFSNNKITVNNSSCTNNNKPKIKPDTHELVNSYRKTILNNQAPFLADNLLTHTTKLNDSWHNYASIGININMDTVKKEFGKYFNSYGIQSKGNNDNLQLVYDAYNKVLEEMPDYNNNIRTNKIDFLEFMNSHETFENCKKSPSKKDIVALASTSYYNTMNFLEKKYRS